MEESRPPDGMPTDKPTIQNPGSPLKQDGSFYESILDGLSDGVCTLDRDLRIWYWNKGAELITGYPATSVIGMKCCEDILIHCNEEGKRLCRTADCLAARVLVGSQAIESEVFAQHSDGHRVPVFARTSPLRNANGEVIGIVQVFGENSWKVAARRRIHELERMALLDPLTHLGNRHYVEMTMLTRVHEMSRYGWQFGVLFIDVDCLKEFNDTYGHHVGDEVLKVVGSMLLSSSRPFDTLGRWGGDEFVAIIVNVHAERLLAIANRLRLLVKESPVPVPGGSSHVTISCGATLAQSKDTLETLLQRADQLMYKAKAAGGNSVKINKD